MLPRVQSIVWMLVLAALYALTARLGLHLATVALSVTLAWPPTGIALAALVLGGTRLWPGVMLGAFVANVVTPGVQPALAAAIAVGNTLEAVFGTWLLRRAGFSPQLQRRDDVLRLLGRGAMLATTVSATIGSISLLAARHIPPADLGHTWLVWWLGDSIGAITFAPLVLCAPAAFHLPPRGRLELAAFAAVFAGLLLSFCDLLPGLRALGFHDAYAAFPALVWAALRLGPPGAALMNVLASTIALLATASGHGPFVRASLGESLVQLQTFMALVSLTTLLLAATDAERKTAIAARDEFISIASHELNTPLTPLMLAIQRARRLIGGDAPARAGLERLLATCERQVARLTRLVEDVLDVAHARSRELALRTEPVDLLELVRDVLDGFAEDFQRGGYSVDLRADGPVPGSWDRLRLQQVTSNLLSNAVKFGEGRPITVSVRVEGNGAVLEVRDQGAGLPRSDQERIFERFERAASPSQAPGMGLGLYIVHRIVTAHGGDVRVESSPGAGTAFIVRLPGAD